MDEQRGKMTERVRMAEVEDAELEARALQATVALIEERVVENLTRIIERLTARLAGKEM
jgi:hypothetical protein